MQTAATNITHELRMDRRKNLKEESEDACCSMRNDKQILDCFFQTMRRSCVTFVAAVCILFLYFFLS